MQPLIPAEDIQRRVREMATEISRDHPLGVHLVCVLKGACIFLADLARALDCDVSIDFIAVSSYGSSTKSSGQVRLLKDLDIALEGRQVVIIEDIVTTGLSIRETVDALREIGANVVAAACIVDRSAGKADMGVPLVALAQYEVPSYQADKLPPELAAIPATKPGSRHLGRK